MPVVQPVKYSEIRSQLNTGDLLAFEGSQPLDYMINLLEEGVYSHVGMVLKDQQGDLWFWDAPGGGRTFYDPYWTGQGANTGCRVAKLDCLLKYYCSDMEIKSFTWRQLTPAMEYAPGGKLDEFLKGMDGTPFPGDHCNLPLPLVTLLKKYLSTQDMGALTLGIGLLLTYLTGAVLLAPVTGYTFCAQLVALTYMAMGLLPEPAGSSTNLPANGYAPAMFMDQPQPLELLGGATLTTPPTTVIWDGDSLCTGGAALTAGEVRKTAVNPLMELVRG